MTNKDKQTTIEFEFNYDTNEQHGVVPVEETKKESHKKGNKSL